MSRKNMELHSFYCMNCGNHIIELPRPRGHKYGKHHRKQLYCPWCKIECNAIECRTDTEVIEFKEQFAEGAYKEEAQASIDFIKKVKGMVS